jgi:hypothetical protein
MLEADFESLLSFNSPVDGKSKAYSPPYTAITRLEASRKKPRYITVKDGDSEIHVYPS